MENKEKILRLGTILCGGGVVALSLVQLLFDIMIPGLNPLATALAFFFLWQLFKVQGKFPGGIWTGFYLLVIVLNIAAAVSQVLAFLG